jgi:hypothetical protein
MQLYHHYPKDFKCKMLLGWSGVRARLEISEGFDLSGRFGVNA